MADDKIFPTKLSEFNDYLDLAVPYLAANSPRLISAGNLTILNGPTGLYSGSSGWTVKYPIANDPTTATKTAREQRDTLKSQIEAHLRIVYHDIPNTVLTQTDRDKLRLHAHDTVPTRSHAEDHAPMMEILKMEHLQHTLRVHDPSTPDSRAMPENQHVIVELFIGAANLDVNDIAFGNAKTFTKAINAIPFTGTDVGKTAYYRCCYESTRAERSVWGVVVSGLVG